MMATGAGGSEGKDEPIVIPPPLDDDDDEDDEEDLSNEDQDRQEKDTATAEDEQVIDVEIIQESEKAIEKLKNSKNDGEETTLLDEMIAASNAAKKIEEKRKLKEETKMNETFGSGLAKTMKANLEKRKEKKTIINALKQQGNDAFQKGKLDEAIQLYSKAIKHCSTKNDGESWFEGEAALYTNRALVYLKQNSAQLAEEDATKALTCDKKWAKGYLWKAKALKLQNRSQRGAQCIERGIEELKNTKYEKLLRSEYKNLFPSEYEIFTLPTISAPKSNTTASDGKNDENRQNQEKANNSLEFPEVQKEMLNYLSSEKWANDNLVKLISENPILAKGMADPKSAILLKKLQENPTAALQEYGTSPEAREFISEMMKVLGTHFNQLEAEGKKQVQKQQMEAAKPAIMTKEEAELQRQADKVLENEEIKKVLSDPETHKILQQCGDPRVLRKYMQDSVWGARLRLLMDHGLVRLEQ